ncbi:MAG TPA: TIGR04282 family arsenosugar biosynthesis glycosyltransferase [Chthoniobacterales bacterium]
MDHRILHPPAPEPILKGRCALAVMIKAPRAGQSKTRLCPPLHPETAAALSRCFYQDTAEALAAVSAADPFGQPVAAYAPLGAEAELAGLIASDIPLLPQRVTDLGGRLRGVIEDLLLLGCDAVALIDSDSPTVPPACYLKLLQVLKADPHAAVIGPADDGGYYVLGVHQAPPDLFAGIAWSTGQVFDQTLAAIQRAGLRAHVLPPWHDVDDSAGLQFLAREFRGELPGRRTGFLAPRTRAFLSFLEKRREGEFLAVPPRRPA